MIRIFYKFFRDQRGVAAVEFAMILPILLALTLGMFEAANYIAANLKFTNASQLLGDLVAQQSNLTYAETADFCVGSKFALAPMATTSFKATVVSVTNKSSGGPTVDWFDQTCGGNPITNAVTLATPYIPNAGDSVIIVQASYTYQSPVFFVLPSRYDLTQTTFSRPRNVANITHS